MSTNNGFTFAGLVRNTREQYGLSQERFAQALEVSRGQVAHIESGRTTPTEAFLTRLTVFEATAQVLIGQ